MDPLISDALLDCCIVAVRKSIEDMVRIRLLEIQFDEQRFQLLREITDSFSDERVIGGGGFGVVYKGILRNGGVAVKRPNRIIFGDKAKNALNFLNVGLGDCYDTEKTSGIAGPRLLSPVRLHNGNLQIPRSIRLQIAIELASALSYMHMPMDPRPSNILLDDYFGKLSDFGCTHNSSWDVEFAVTTSAKGRTEIKIGSNVTHLPTYSSIHHPLVQMVLFACNKFDDSFSRLKSISPKSIYDMAMRLSSSVWTIVCGNDWISASRKSDSPKMGTISEFDTMNNIGWRKEPTENQSHHSDPDSSRAEHGIKAVGTKTPAAWVIATGAPHHATGDRGLLSGFITEHNDLFVHAADGVPMKVLARGAMVTDAVVLPDVWFVPGLTANLVSVSQLTELDYSIGFGCGECCISAAGKVVGKAHLQEGGLYVLDFLKVPLAI